MVIVLSTCSRRDQDYMPWLMTNPRQFLHSVGPFSHYALSAANHQFLKFNVMIIAYNCKWYKEPQCLCYRRIGLSTSSCYFVRRTTNHHDKARSASQRRVDLPKQTNSAHELVSSSVVFQRFTKLHSINRSVCEFPAFHAIHHLPSSIATAKLCWKGRECPNPAKRTFTLLAHSRVSANRMGWYHPCHVA